LKAQRHLSESRLAHATLQQIQDDPDLQQFALRDVRCSATIARRVTAPADRARAAIPISTMMFGFGAASSKTFSTPSRRACAPRVPTRVNRRCPRSDATRF
jgi:hypothetical protein